MPLNVTPTLILTLTLILILALYPEAQPSHEMHSTSIIVGDIIAGAIVAGANVGSYHHYIS